MAVCSNNLNRSNLRTAKPAHKPDVALCPLSILTNGRIYSKKGFTLIELLVTIAIVLILSGLLLPTLMRAKERANQASCRNNLRQLTIAMINYVTDNNDIFPGQAAKDQIQPVPEDWVYWITTNNKIPGGSRDPKSSPVGRYLGSFNLDLFRCPSDSEAERRKSINQENTVVSGGQARILDSKIPLYSFSYTFNSLISSAGNEIQNHGFASLYGTVFEPIHFRIGSVRFPSQKFMLVEEQSTSGQYPTPDDGRFNPVENKITTRHLGKGMSAMADGHVELVKPEFTKIDFYFDASK
jgi:prepilin-type N-terminal cleavage/methylation domain-containing protein/prepilin-type processing-associated H-X9-DG protein